MTDSRPKPWLALAPCVIAIMAVANLQYTWTLFALPLKDAFGAKLSAVQLAFTLYIVAQTWLAPLEGWLADRFAPRPLALAGAVLVGLNWIGAGLARSLPALYGSCVIGGFGCGLVMAAGGQIALSRFSDRRGAAIGLVSMAYGLGPVLAVVPIERTIQACGYRAAFVSWGVFQAAIVIASAFFMDAARPTRRGVASRRPLAFARTTSFAWMYAALALVATSGLLITAQLAPMARGFGLSDRALLFGVGAVVFAIMLDRVTNAAARPFWGAVSDRLGRAETMALAFLLEAAAITLLAGSADRPMRFVALSGAAFFAWGEIFSLFPALVADVFGVEDAMTNYGALFTAKGVASLFAGWGAARLIERHVPWTGVLFLCAACDLVAALIVFFPLRTRIAQEKTS